MNKSSPKKFLQEVQAEVEKKLHVNLYEHSENPIRFVGSFVLFGLLGTLFGGLLDRLIAHFQGTTTNKTSCAEYLLLNLILVGLLVYMLLRFKQVGLRFDDWMMGTFSGFIFALAFFNTQEKLSKNMQCLVL